MIRFRRSKLACLATFVVFACVPLIARAASAVEILVVGDDATLQPIRSRLSDVHTEAFAAWTIWIGLLDGHAIALTRSEGDPLNAVAATTLAVRHHPPGLILTCGTARAHDPALRAGDVVVSEQFAAFDGVVSPHADFGAGSHPLAWERLPHALITPGEKENYVLTFPADPAAAQLALTLQAKSGRVVSGVLGSAHQINREADRIAFLRAQWHTSTEDPESAHIAGCAALLGVPVVGVRVVDGSPADAAEFALQFLAARK